MKDASLGPGYLVYTSGADKGAHPRARKDRKFASARVRECVHACVCTRVWLGGGNPATRG